jgi:chemotaxis protein MotA
MDFTVPIGIIVGLLMIILSIYVGGFPFYIYWDIISVFITIGGSFCALTVSMPWETTRNAWRVFKIALMNQRLNINSLIPMLVAFSEKSRREGLLSLEDDLEGIEDNFFKTGLQLVVDGTDPDVIKNIMYNEMNQIDSRHSGGIKFYDLWSKQAPAWGMIGTLYGLVGMLRSMGDPSAIGIGMASALITTFYGAVLSYLVFLPTKTKLEDRHGSEMLVKEIILEGILSIQTGDNPRIVEQKLLAFLDPNLRVKLKQTD